MLITSSKNLPYRRNVVYLHTKIDNSNITMMKSVKGTCTILLMMTLLASCVANTEHEGANDLLEQAKDNYSHGKFELALNNLDSIRTKYHDQIEVRKQAILLRQDIELKKAQRELALVDSSLMAANKLFNILDAQANVDKLKGLATAEQLKSVILQRMKRDSLQVRFDVLAGQIRYIHKKKKENGD